MPLIKVVQIGPLYQQLRAFPQALTLTIVIFFEKTQDIKITEKTYYCAPLSNPYKHSLSDTENLT